MSCLFFALDFPFLPILFSLVVLLLLMCVRLHPPLSLNHSKAVVVFVVCSVGFCFASTFAASARLPYSSGRKNYHIHIVKGSTCLYVSL